MVIRGMEIKLISCGPNGKHKEPWVGLIVGRDEVRPWVVALIRPYVPEKCIPHGPQGPSTVRIRLFTPKCNGIYLVCDLSSRGVPTYHFVEHGNGVLDQLDRLQAGNKLHDLFPRTFTDILAPLVIEEEY